MSRLYKTKNTDGVHMVIKSLEDVEGEYGIIEAGTPIGADGKIHNDEEAIGIMRDTAIKQLQEAVDIITTGIVDLPEVEETSGITLSAACRAALTGIRFVNGNKNIPFVADGDPAISG